MTVVMNVILLHAVMIIWEFTWRTDILLDIYYVQYLLTLKLVLVLLFAVITKVRSLNDLLMCHNLSHSTALHITDYNNNNNNNHCWIEN